MICNNIKDDNEYSQQEYHNFILNEPVTPYRRGFIELKIQCDPDRELPPFDVTLKVERRYELNIVVHETIKETREERLTEVKESLRCMYKNASIERRDIDTDIKKIIKDGGIIILNDNTKLIAKRII